ncbi:MAG: accessory factor UbiK family protein [Sinobacteraceae bacterium]|nr:accessory factor UbiK family protein [Nevskiaceae bacterium]
MTESRRIDELARRLLESLPPGLRSVQQDLENNFRAVLRAGLARLDLVPRDEFDAQVRVLQRTRARLEELERRVAELSGQSGTGPAAAATPAPATGPTLGPGPIPGR